MYLNQRSELSSYNIGDFSYAGPDFQVLTWGKERHYILGSFVPLQTR